jgi:hypothetical protein
MKIQATYIPKALLNIEAYQQKDVSINFFENCNDII